MQKTYHPLYKLDSKGKTRVWYMEQDGDRYRTFDGVHGGTVKASAYRTAKPTNVGRSNERDGVAQATFEIEAAYTKQLKGAYYEDIADIGLGCRFLEPMLAPTSGFERDKFTAGYAQPKLDGIRCIITVDGGFSREGEPIPGAAHIRRALDPYFAVIPHLVLDGELYNHDLKDDFNELVSLIKKGAPNAERLAQIESLVQFHVYDLPKCKGGYANRHAALTGVFANGVPPCIRLVETVYVSTIEQFDDLHGKWVGEGFEGSMWRCQEGSYECGKRSKFLQKRKDFDDAEFDIVRIEEGEGNWAGAAKRVVCWLPNADRTQEPSNDNTFEAGLRGSYAKNQALLADADNQKVVTIRYFGFTPSAIPKPRFGVATKFHGEARTL